MTNLLWLWLFGQGVAGVDPVAMLLKDVCTSRPFGQPLAVDTNSLLMPHLAPLSKYFLTQRGLYNQFFHDSY